MANELINIIVGILGGIVIGMVLHSGMGHTYHDKLWILFHEPDKKVCYGKDHRISSTRCSICNIMIGCRKKCLTSLE